MSTPQDPWNPWNNDESSRRDDPPPYGQQYPPGHGWDPSMPPPPLPPSYGSPPGYQQPGLPQQPPPPRTNGLAVGSLVVSLVSTFACCGAIGFVGALMGHVARGQIRATGEQGDGLALAGIIIGWITTLLLVAGVLVWIGLIGVAAAGY
ncbi:DUF4190 domain-containing protein [Hoyosella subflava]|uniref:DUF4190 domain-containing protein n=1 Tax=Hoyosella subflava TaxID=639313 RepID=UPI00178C5A1B|nr:DUF4190 domain-containing protein [Hoyosella subflava]